jgi:predicted ATPase
VRTAAGSGIIIPNCCIKGELLLQDATGRPVSAAEDCFRAVLDVAREQGALFWELGGALSLAGLRVTEGRRSDVKAILAPIYDQCTEGFETADLRAAPWCATTRRSMIRLWPW